MRDPIALPGRRRILHHLVVGATGLASYGILGTPGVFAEALLRTPGQAAGPFYPRTIPLDADNDLIVVGDSLTPARKSVVEGQSVDLGGRGDIETKKERDRLSR